MTENAAGGDAGSAVAAMRVTGRAQGTARGFDQSVYLLEVDGGSPFVAAWQGSALTIRSAMTGEAFGDQGLTGRVRTVIALYNASDVIVTAEQDENGTWSARAILAPGIAAVGQGTTRQEAVDECNDGLDALLDELRATA